MIMCPMFTKQPLKSKILLERLEISLQICLGVRSVPSEEKVREYVVMLLVEEQGKTIRRRAKALSKIDEIVVEKEGSSYMNLESFVQEMQNLHDNPVVFSRMNY